MSSKPETRFRITSWDEKPIHELGNGRKIVTANVSQAYEGELQGQANVVYVMFYQDEKTARFTGYETLECEYRGLSGRFVISHDGEYGEGKARSHWRVVSDSATGELAGLSGSGSFEAGHGGEAMVSLNLKLG